MRHICTFIPAATITGAPALGTTANAQPPPTGQRQGERSARAAATPKLVIVRAAGEPATGHMDWPLAPGGDDVAA
jgi:hypothetical protein